MFYNISEQIQPGEDSSQEHKDSETRQDQKGNETKKRD